MVAPEEAPIVCRIFKDYVRLASPLMIARNLNAEGIPYRNGKPWTAKTIQRILHNPLYIGKVTHKGETFQGEHEALISETLWQQANDTAWGARPRAVLTQAERCPPAARQTLLRLLPTPHAPLLRLPQHVRGRP